MKVLRYSFLGLLGVALLLLIVAAVFILTFDPRQYKEDIEQLVHRHTGRTLVLSDDIQMSLYPNLGISVGPTKLTEKDQKTTFISVESAQVSVALLPLLKQEVMVDGLRLSGMVANITRQKQGSFNFDDLIQSTETPNPENSVEITTKDGSAKNIVFDVTGIELKDGTVNYSDPARNQQITVKALNLKTGQIAPNAQGEFVLSGQVIAAALPIDAKVAISTKYALDLPAQHAHFEGLTFNLTGSAFQLQNLNLTSKTNLEADFKNARFDLKNIEFDAASKALFKASLRSAGLIWNENKFSLQQLILSANLDQPRQKFGMQWQAPEITGSSSQVNVAKFTSTLQVDMPDVLRNPLKIPVNGDLMVNLNQQSLRTNLDARVDDSKLRAAIQIPKFEPLASRADITIDQIDLDRYLQATSTSETAAKESSSITTATSATSPAAATSPTTVDLSALKSLDTQIKLSVGQLRLYGVAISDFKTDIQAKNGQLRVGPHAAKLATGTVQGDIKVDANRHQFSIQEKLQNIAIGPLLSELGQPSRIEGIAQLDLNLTTQGQTTAVLKQNLAGQLGFKVADGAIRGIDLARLLRSIQGVLTTGKLPEFSADDKTVFTELSGTAKIQQGIAVNNDLDMKAPIFRLQGQGEVNLGTDQIDYLVKLAVVETTQGQGGPELQALKGISIPVRLLGPIDNIRYQLDIPLIAAEIAKSRAGQTIADRIDQAISPETKEKVDNLLGPDLANKLKGLFGGR